ncbi:hypothetical protein CF54_20390 [Streptomyces sp. Tu 6176]|uniref:DUF4232 domain-containing protein n=1 Tax=Streptomyces sp. Tu 6176 TaxID=1470557 RepID=UPI000452B2C6|nr:DUF4232 domain-containing protein [Streptomyces sp. Tu 6176]EYT81296.1 hypothetical protein CF54_20390 [Streptomyces sp. Tu 6176]
MRVHKATKVTCAALVVAASLSLTACQSDDDGGTGQSAPSSAATVPSADGGTQESSGSGSGGSSSSGKTSGGQNAASGTGSGQSGGTGGTGGSGGSGGSGAAGGLGKCRTSDLTITASDATVGGDPDLTVAVQFKNRSGLDCTLSGYAGVDLKTNYDPVSAKRSGEKAGTSVLKAGKSTYFGIHYPANKTGGTGVRIMGLLVTPPDETRTVTLAWPGAPSLPVTESGGDPITVGPIGSAGQGE